VVQSRGQRQKNIVRVSAFETESTARRKSITNWKSQRRVLIAKFVYGAVSIDAKLAHERSGSA
jgi:hypothetical protein